MQYNLNRLDNGRQSETNSTVPAAHLLSLAGIELEPFFTYLLLQIKC